MLKSFAQAGVIGRVVANALLLSIAIPIWSVAYHQYLAEQVRIPEVVGATPEDQRSLVPRFFYLGRQYRATLAAAHSVSWYEAANIYENGETWSAVKRHWSDVDQAQRDAPFLRIVEPELRRIAPLDRGPNPDQRRRGAVALKAFAAGLASP